MAINYPFGLQLKQKFVEFVHYQGLFHPCEIDKIVAFWDEDNKIKATLSGDEKYNENLRKSDVMFIKNTTDNDWIYNKLAH
ncbi:hypothetical protein [Patiriisocius sp. Uisw_017]|jgi:PKHD-type hydroxylase|uniref:hypothetical protein n=1 Tax=Patiriisocius sp. Uisw_017 TaxID=3230968 RepID=UPI0039EA0EA1